MGHQASQLSLARRAWGLMGWGLQQLSQVQILAVRADGSITFLLGGRTGEAKAWHRHLSQARRSHVLNERALGRPAEVIAEGHRGG